MILRRAFYFLPILILTIQLGFAQGREEVFHPAQPDPIKLIQVYPNPATEYVSVKFEAPIAKKVSFSFHNILGSALNLETEAIDDHEIKIRVKDLNSGYYFISVQDEKTNFKSTYKFLKR